MIKINDLRANVKLAELTGTLDLRSVDNKTNVFELNNSKIRWDVNVVGEFLLSENKNSEIDLNPHFFDQDIDINVKKIEDFENLNIIYDDINRDQNSPRHPSLTTISTEVLPKSKISFRSFDKNSFLFNWDGQCYPMLDEVNSGKVNFSIEGQLKFNGILVIMYEQSKNDIEIATQFLSKLFDIDQYTNSIVKPYPKDPDLKHIQHIWFKN